MTVEHELATATQQLKTMVAQLDAAKQMINESMTANLNLRTNLNIFQQLNQEQSKKINELSSQVQSLTKELESLKVVPIDKDQPVDAA